MNKILKFLSTCTAQDLSGLGECLDRITNSEREDLVISLLQERDHFPLDLLRRTDTLNLFKEKESREKLLSVLIGLPKNEDENFVLTKKYLKTISLQELETIADKNFSLFRAAFQLPIDYSGTESDKKLKLKKCLINDNLKKFTREEFEKFLSVFEIEDQILEEIFEKVFPYHLSVFLSRPKAEQLMGKDFELDHNDFLTLIKIADFESLKLIETKGIRINFDHESRFYSEITDSWWNLSREKVEKLLDFKFNLDSQIEYQKSILTLARNVSRESSFDHSITFREVKYLCEKYGFFPSRTQGKENDELVKIRSDSSPITLDDYSNLGIGQEGTGNFTPPGSKTFFQIYTEIWKNISTGKGGTPEMVRVIRSRKLDFLMLSEMGRLGPDLESHIKNFCLLIRSQTRSHKEIRELSRFVMEELESLTVNGFSPSGEFFLYLLTEREYFQEEEVWKLIKECRKVDDLLVDYILYKDKGDILSDPKLYSSINHLSYGTVIRLLKLFPERMINKVNHHLVMTVEFLELAFNELPWSTFSRLKNCRKIEQESLTWNQ